MTWHCIYWQHWIKLLQFRELNIVAITTASTNCKQQSPIKPTAAVFRTEFKYRGARDKRFPEIRGTRPDSYHIAWNSSLATRASTSKISAPECVCVAPSGTAPDQIHHPRSVWIREGGLPGRIQIACISLIPGMKGDEERNKSPRARSESVHHDDDDHPHCGCVPGERKIGFGSAPGGCRWGWRLGQQVDRQGRMGVWGGNRRNGTCKVYYVFKVKSWSELACKEVTVQGQGSGFETRIAVTDEVVGVFQLEVLPLSFSSAGENVHIGTFHLSWKPTDYLGDCVVFVILGN